MEDGERKERERLGREIEVTQSFLNFILYFPCCHLTPVDDLNGQKLDLGESLSLHKQQNKVWKKE